MPQSKGLPVFIIGSSATARMVASALSKAGHRVTMCTGALYWTGVLRLVYGISEKKLLGLTGDNPENPTFSLDCRSVIRSGQKTITVVGPVEDPALVEAILADHIGFWK